MFGPFGFQEVLIILLVAVIIFGKNLPEVSRSLARGLGELRKGFLELKSDVNLDTSIKDELQQDLKSALYQDVDPDTNYSELAADGEDPYGEGEDPYDNDECGAEEESWDDDTISTPTSEAEPDTDTSSGIDDPDLADKPEEGEKLDREDQPE